jgi:hypothetical protein
LPGRKARATSAKVFIEDESCILDCAVNWDARAVCNPAKLSL